MFLHKPVLLQSACAFLNIRKGAKYIDATVGGGGHSSEIIRQGGLVLGLDQDPEALAAAATVSGLTLVQSNFIHLKEVAQKHNWTPVAGILLDLGVSQHQVAEAGRGFSFQQLGPLDMRMDPSLPNTAATLVNSLPEADLAKIIFEYGEEPGSKSLAAKIIAARPISTTDQLAAIIGSPDRCRRVFQALRIAVNDELGALQTVLPQAHDLLDHQGRLVIISFHSLEDRIVKHAFANWVAEGKGRVLTGKPVVGERNAKLRAYEKI